MRNHSILTVLRDVEVFGFAQLARALLEIALVILSFPIVVEIKGFI